VDIFAFPRISLEEKEETMQSLALFIAFLTGFLGIYLGFHAFKNFSQITRGEASLRQVIMNSIIAGSGGVLIFFTIIVIMGFLDKTYIWTIDRFYGAIVLSLIPGGLITIGSFIQSLTIIGYKGILFESLRKKNKDK
jgi:hypothetical protein